MHILIVEDDEAISNLLYQDLSDEGYDCMCALDGRQAADLLEENTWFDLVLLDIMLPGIDGYELLEYIRPMNIPVIFLTAKGAVKDRIYGLRQGADDYIVKPFQTGEVLARMEAVLRRYGKNNSLLSFANVTVDLSSRKVFQAVSNDQPESKTEIELTAKEFDLLTELIRNKNIAQYRDKLYEKVWNEPFFGDTRTLDTHIQRLRKKLGWESYIKTVFRIGYRLEES
ncbi:MAG: response regulator transcription factor [Eubacterium sp.]|nr:response regulator transcription factor [Eubacterium sp.]